MHPASTQPASDANPHDTTPPPRIGPRVFWTIVLLGLLVLALRGCHNARREVRKSSCCYNLKFIALSLQDYQDTYGSLPPVHLVDSAGTPIHSWRTMISPYYFYNSETDYFAQLDLSKPWDDPVNTAVLDRYVGTMQCPDREDSTDTTQYVAVFGEGTAWPQPITGDQLPEPLSDEGRAANHKLRKAKQEQKEKSKQPPAKILVVEWPESDVEWTEPRDLSVKEFLQWFEAQRGKPTIHPGDSILYLGDDFEVHELPLETSLDEVRRRLTVDPPSGE